MTEQSRILHDCTHEPRPCEVSIPGGASVRVCNDCWNRSVDVRQAARKAQLDAMPRCEVDGCQRRSTWTVSGGVGLCGWHMRRMKREHNRRMASIGGMGLFMTVNYGREAVLSMATAPRSGKRSGGMLA